MVIPDTAAHVDGHPVITHTYIYCLADRKDSRLVASFLQRVAAMPVPE